MQISLKLILYMEVIITCLEERFYFIVWYSTQTV